MRCAQCKREISLLAKTCPHCGAAVSELGTLSTPSPPLPSQSQPVRLYEVAYRQKLVLYAVLVNILTLVASAFLGQLNESPIARILTALSVVVSLCVIVFFIWAYYKLGVALGIPKAVICLGAACLIFPCISLIVLLRITRIATRKLERAGVQVGLLGADLDEIPKES